MWRRLLAREGAPADSLGPAEGELVLAQDERAPLLPSLLKHDRDCWRALRAALQASGRPLVSAWRASAEAARGRLAAPLSFVADGSLGGLARWIRGAGYATHWRAGARALTLVAEAFEAGAVLLTTDSLALDFGLIRGGALVTLWLPSSLSRAEQLRLVFEDLGLRPGAARCMRCGGALGPVAKEAVRARIPPRTALWKDDYFVCRLCDHLYWEGTHWLRIAAALSGAGGEPSAGDEHEHEHTGEDEGRRRGAVMSGPRSIRELDLRPLPGKKYWRCDREWREEFIYFLMVDRFHDGRERRPVAGPGRSPGGGRPDQLRRFCGGTLKGIERHLGYIADLGCTAVWLSPVFENDDAPDPRSSSYHGYAIRNYLAVDPRFGTKQDLIDLVEAAHRRGLRVFLDAVANHAGNVFYYPEHQPYFYSDDSRQYEIGGWNHPDYPLPVELRNPAYFHRRGEIRAWAWDSLPETQWGDFFSLKGFNNDETPDGLALQDIIIDAHRYWLREADIDGYRMDAVKHMGEMAVARFCQALREYAYSLGKSEFFLFGELVAGDAAINRYAGPNTRSRVGDKTVFYGLSSVLDFPLWWVLPGVIKGFNRPTDLFNRYEALRERALNRGELGRYLVTFVDNHDQIGQNVKRRFASGARDEQVVAAIGYLLCALGTPCLYYGTEQGFAGEGPSEDLIREALFDPDDPQRDFLNRDCGIYREISRLARVNRELPALRFGRMYFRETAADGVAFSLPRAQPCTLAFSRLLGKQEVLFAYNTSVSERRVGSVVVDEGLNREGGRMRCVYGAGGEVEVQRGEGPAAAVRFVRLDLAPMQLVILARD